MKGFAGLNKAVLRARMKLELSQSDFAKKVGVTAMSVSRWESGANDPPARCVVQMAKMSDDNTSFWHFLNHIGLSKKDFKGRI